MYSEKALSGRRAGSIWKEGSTAVALKMGAGTAALALTASGRCAAMHSTQCSPPGLLPSGLGP